MPKKAQSTLQLFKTWCDADSDEDDVVKLYVEKASAREKVFSEIVNRTTVHLIGLSIKANIRGFRKSIHLLRNRIPTCKIARSGFIGEILASEYVSELTNYSVPVRRLVYRDTRELAMRGDDVLAFQVEANRIQVLKVEAKSRVQLSSATLKEARDGLAKHKGRPNPESLAFIECMLRFAGRDKEAEPIMKLQQRTIRTRDVQHLVFTVSQSDPKKLLDTHCGTVCDKIKLNVCGLKIAGHAQFVKRLFDACRRQGG